MTPGYKLLRKILGEAILSGNLNKREKGLAKGLYESMGKGAWITPDAVATVGQAEPIGDGPQSALPGTALPGTAVPAVDDGVPF